MTELLTPETIDDFTTRAAALEHPMELVIDVLRAIQSRHGWVPDEGVELAAQLLRTSPLKIEEVATFYDKIYRQPVGRRVIHICDSICCWSRGGKKSIPTCGKNWASAPARRPPTALSPCCRPAVSAPAARRRH
jgi:NADH-quinone oxidoreductase subunit E